VLVTFTDSGGDPVTFQATPGDSDSGSLRVQLDPLNRINFELEPVGGAATGVEYQLDFVCDCLP
jgi:hypothetical protein